MLHYLLLFAIKDYMIDKKEIIIKNLQDFIFLLQINNDNIFFVVGFLFVVGIDVFGIENF